ncbi:hybrid sensor histidine kinase/response regulator [Psychromonas hadalis]|uniref:hybrid sensor histidine kinase/response regulator n=1 Tax=Psychromonas hadalis TaxID=211669 RepID=UPI00041D06E7|nr:hybrid sensor histidine kinase/response regulator [Psychromonas hadalis]
MSNIQTNKAFLFKRWQSLRVYNIVILTAFLFFYSIGTLQSYSFFMPPAAFNLPFILPLSAIFLCAYLIHCLVTEKDKISIRLIPILTLFTTLFITINSHFETETSQNSFLYFTLLLPLFYAYILAYNFQLLIINNLVAIVSYTFTAVVGDTSTLVFILNLLFLFTLGFLTLYSHIKNNTYSSKGNTVKAIRGPTLNQKNSLYLSNIIHDIRQPLSSLALYSYLLEKQIDDEKSVDLMKNLLGASNQLDRWLSSLLELATLDSNTLKVTIKSIPLATCLSSVIKKQNEKIASQGMTLKLHLGNTVLYTDTKLLSEIIDNLLSNALLHGSQKRGGTILLSARNLQNTINIQVWNKGTRINNEHLNSLFDELYYPKNPNHNKAKGLGLGLALSQRKATLLNSQIKVKTSDNGSCFSIQIAKGLATREVIPPAQLTQENNENILLIDDDTSILSALSMLLENWGYKVDCAENSEQAINALENKQFALMISDYRLPGDKNGIDLIKIAQQKQGIPSLLLTGEVDPDKFKEGEFRNYKVLHKPIKPAALRLLLRQLLS